MPVSWIWTQCLGEKEKDIYTMKELHGRKHIVYNRCFTAKPLQMGKRHLFVLWFDPKLVTSSKNVLFSKITFALHGLFILASSAKIILFLSKTVIKARMTSLSILCILTIKDFSNTSYTPDAQTSNPDIECIFLNRIFAGLTYFCSDLK